MEASLQQPYTTTQDCYLTAACARVKALPDDCYELGLLRMFRREYIAQLPAGDHVLTDYDQKSPRIVRAIEALGIEEAYVIYSYLYEEGIRNATRLIVNGRWDEAYGLYCAMCEWLEDEVLTKETTREV